MNTITDTLDTLSDEPYAYLTTEGRVSGLPHEIEIWWCHRDTTVFVLAGDGPDADWVQNLQSNPHVGLRVGFLTTQGSARIIGDPEEEAFVRRTLLEKYERQSSQDLTEWSVASLPVAIDV